MQFLWKQNFGHLKEPKEDGESSSTSHDSDDSAYQT
tara:strand:- start:16 stop:123 length:108 start_codon:yes stop_codon:yes gene_type:complete